MADASGWIIARLHFLDVFGNSLASADGLIYPRIRNKENAMPQTFDINRKRTNPAGAGVVGPCAASRDLARVPYGLRVALVSRFMR